MTDRNAQWSVALSVAAEHLATLPKSKRPAARRAFLDAMRALRGHGLDASEFADVLDRLS